MPPLTLASERSYFTAELWLTFDGDRPLKLGNDPTERSWRF